jgi:DNA-binding MarR family transcriptional regulator
VAVAEELDESQVAAWRHLQLMHFQLTARLNRELAGQTGLSYPDFLVLAVLRDRPDGRMRAFELGKELGWEKSRVSHHVARMLERGLVKRERCTADQRGAFVVVTAKGRKAIEVAAPLHLDNVRRHFVDLVTDAELATLSTVARRVLERLALDAAADCDGPGGGDG